MLNIDVTKKILNKNDLLAEKLREFYKKNNIYVINIVSSPGSGKTSLLEVILPELKKFYSIFVLVGDLQTENDADRIKKTAVPVKQINTGKSCHLTAKEIYDMLQAYEEAESLDLLIIENVGNLVCPSSFDLGEDIKMLVISTSEGDDKPLKYPSMVNVADCLIINKMDLLPYVNFDVDRCVNFARKINPSIAFFITSCYSKEGINPLIEHIKKIVDEKIL
jgi:hydrogenase nickel incorporation protein HypB